MEAGSNNTSSRTTLIILTVLVIAAVIAAAVSAGLWQRQRQETNRLEESVSQLQKEKSEESSRLSERIDRLEEQLEAEEPETPATTTPDQPVSNLFISPKGIVIQIDTPAENSQIASPLTITGKVPGSWSFEASFPVVLKDSNGTTIAQGPAQLQGDWMTEEQVPFTATLTFAAPATASGFLILQRDNPSGLPENDDSISIEVSFS